MAAFNLRAIRSHVNQVLLDEPRIHFMEWVRSDFSVEHLSRADFDKVAQGYKRSITVLGYRFEQTKHTYKANGREYKVKFYSWFDDDSQMDALSMALNYSQTGLTLVCVDARPLKQA